MSSYLRFSKNPLCECKRFLIKRVRCHDPTISMTVINDDKFKKRMKLLCSLVDEVKKTTMMKLEVANKEVLDEIEDFKSALRDAMELANKAKGELQQHN